MMMMRKNGWLICLALLLVLLSAGCANRTGKYNGQFPVAGLHWEDTAEVAAKVLGTEVTPSASLGGAVEKASLEVYGYTFQNVQMTYGPEGDEKLYILNTAPTDDVGAALASITKCLGEPEIGDSFGIPDDSQPQDAPGSYVWMLTDSGSMGEGYVTRVVLYGQGYVDDSDNQGAPADTMIGKLVLSRRKTQESNLME